MRIFNKQCLAFLCGLMVFTACGNSSSSSGNSGQVELADDTEQPEENMDEDVDPKDMKQEITLLPAETWKQVTRITYKYGDSSLPPDYHRSYDIVVDADSVCVTIHSYGTTLLHRSYSNSAGKFTQFLERLQECEIGTMTVIPDRGCTGGTTDFLELGDIDGKTLYSASVYHCDGAHGTLYVGKGDLQNTMNTAVPESMENLIESTMEF